MERGMISWYYILSWTLAVLALLGLVTVGILGVRMKLFRNRRILLRVTVSVISLAVLSLAAAVLLFDSRLYFTGRGAVHFRSVLFKERGDGKRNNGLRNICVFPGNGRGSRDSSGKEPGSGNVENTA